LWIADVSWELSAKGFSNVEGVFVLSLAAGMMVTAGWSGNRENEETAPTSEPLLL